MQWWICNIKPCLYLYIYDCLPDCWQTSEFTDWTIHQTGQFTECELLKIMLRAIFWLQFSFKHFGELTSLWIIQSVICLICKFTIWYLTDHNPVCQQIMVIPFIFCVACYWSSLLIHQSLKHLTCYNFFHIFAILLGHHSP